MLEELRLVEPKRTGSNFEVNVCYLGLTSSPPDPVATSYLKS